jgi:hypothetical protein
MAGRVVGLVGGEEQRGFRHLIPGAEPAEWCIEMKKWPYHQ